jgi:L-ribulokinase
MKRDAATYAVGLDYGTESGRAMLVRVAEGLVVATGGLPDRNALLMQIYADVTGREVQIAASSQTAALGSAMFGAVAAGSAAGGYDTIEAANAQMARLRDEKTTPIPVHTAIYDRLYAEYVTLHGTYGRGVNDVMKRLKRLRAEAHL